MKKIVIAAGIVISAALVVWCAIFLIKKNRVVPANEVLVEYMACIETGDYEKMYNLLAEQSKAGINEERFIERNQKIYDGIEAANVRIKVNEEESSEHTVLYTTKMDSAAGEIIFDNEAEFVKTEGVYHLIWSDQMIFPQLNSQDKVKVAALLAKRGEIYDRTGKLLAGEGLVSSVGLVPGKLSGEQQDLERLAELLEISVENVEKKLDASWVKEDSFVPIKKLKKKEQTIEELLGEAVPDEQQEALLAIPGVMISDVKDRVYPLGEKAAHLTGYVQGISAEELEELKGQGYNAQSVIGKSGLESLYEERLHGKSGCKITIVDKNDEEKEVLSLKMEENGENITTTIDAGVQAALYEQYSADKSCSVAMNPITGEVLALVNTPSFDSNDFVLGLSQKKWDTLNEDENQPLLNRFRQVWCPGSSIKPIVGAIGLGAKAFTEDEDFGPGTTSWKKDESWGSYEITTLHSYEGGTTLKNALIYSDNIYFAKAALKIGEDSYTKNLEKAGFGQELPFAITMKSSQYTNGESMASEIQLADSGYGQGQMLVNPLHLAAMYTAFLNGGDIIKPYLEYEAEKAPEIWIQGAFSPEASGIISADLAEVINNPEGTGYKAYMDGVALAGKTGTAEIKASKEDMTGTELGWFAVYTADNTISTPILLVTMVEDVKERGGSSYVVEGERAVLERILQQ